MELIPGLISEMARECLIRVPFESFPSMSSVSKSWNFEIRQPEFHRQRKQSNQTQPIVVLAQAMKSPLSSPPEQQQEQAQQQGKTPTYWLTALDPESGSWTRLPPAPWLPDGLPIFAGLVACGSNLLVLGGWDPATWQASKAVYVFDFLSGRWRRGTDMPGADRSLFGCSGSGKDGVVVVAGGHDRDKRALRSALAYDVAGDRWSVLGEMARERDECCVIFYDGRFWAVGGYPTERQGRFERSAEPLDLQTGLWGPLDEGFVEEAGVGRGCLVVGGDDGEELYYYSSSSSSSSFSSQGASGFNVSRKTSSGHTWQRVIADVPSEVALVQHVAAAWNNGNLMLIGSSSTTADEVGAQMCAYVCHSGSGRSTKILPPPNYPGNVQSACFLYL